MIKDLKLMMTVAALAVFFAGVGESFAQTTTKPPTVGGYKTVAVTDTAVVAAAQFAVSDHSEKNNVSLEIVTIQKAERQTVQGANYRMCIEVKVVEEGNDDTQFVLATVYQDLKRAYKTTSWKPDGCGTPVENIPMVGGYKTVPVKDAGVMEAAQFAVSQHSQKNDVSLEIVRIQKAEQQVVAGMNYQMCIEVKVTEAGNPGTQFVKAVVYRNLQNEFSLTSWEADACGKKGK